MRRFFLFFLGVIATLPVSFDLKSQDKKKIPSEQPKLIVGIIVSQMRYDYLFRYWEKLENNGIKKMVDRGTFCKNSGFNYLFSQEGVGHASIATGTSPSNHGIIGSEWYINLNEKIVKNTDDESVKTIGGEFESGRKSPVNLMASTFADELRLSNNFKSKVISISLNPSPAVLSGGHTANAAYWFDGASGNFITSSYYMNSLPEWVIEFNAKKLPDIYMQKEWNTLLPIDKYTESLPDNNKYETGFAGKTSFPYILTEISNSGKKNKNYSILSSTPFGNSLIKDFATTAILSDSLGKDQYTDVLMISLSATEQIGNLFGPNSIEVEDAFLRMDNELAHFLDFIDSNIGKENVLIFFTADHGSSQVPAYLSDMKVPSGYFNSKGALSLLNSAMNNVYGKGEWIKSYTSQQIYLNRNLIEDSRLSLQQVQDYVAQFILQFTGVANTVTATTLQNTDFTSGIFQKIQNSFNQKNSGDVIINLKPGWIDKTEGSFNHNSSYAYDSRVPLIWYGWKTGRKTVLRHVDIIDIAPTISSFLNISYPNACIGQPIYELLE